MELAAGKAQALCLEKEETESYLLLRKLRLSHATPFIWTCIPDCLDHSSFSPPPPYCVVQHRQKEHALESSTPRSEIYSSLFPMTLGILLNLLRLGFLFRKISTLIHRNKIVIKKYTGDVGPQ